MKIKLLFIFLICQFKFATAQISSISTEEICVGQEVLVAVKGENLMNIGALTMYIGYDTLNLTFLSVENIDSQLIGMSANLMTNPTQLAFAWSNPTPINFINEKIFDLKFISNGISSDVYFNSGCELSDTDGVVIPATLLNGAVNTGIPEIVDNPVDTTVSVGSNAMFDVLAINATSYLWRESSDNGISWLALEDDGIYSGTKTSVLTIQSVPVSYNNNLYQCILFQGNCQVISEHAILTVEIPAGFENTHGVSGNSIIIYPVPFINTTNLFFNVNPNCTVDITVTNSLGQIVTDVLCSSISEGSRHIELNTSNWQSGIYVVRLLQRNSSEIFECIKRIVKK